MPRTLEQRIKFDSSLSIGTHLLTFTHNGNAKLALVEIGPRGRVWAFTEPSEGDMYASWYEIKGDSTFAGKGRLVTWPQKNPELMSAFNGPPRALLPLAV